MNGITIKLSNFRTHVSKECTFPSNGLIRLAGKNGQGKSTILNAMVFALYGKVKKPYTRGVKKTCKVELDAFGMKVIRTARPNRIQVTYEDTEYEGEAAEGMIQTVMGMNHNDFMVSSYIVQLEKNRVSILSITPAEQLRVIQTLAFNNNKNVEIKNQVKALIRSTLEEKVRLEGQVHLLTEQLAAKEEERGEEPEKPENLDEGIDAEMVMAQNAAYVEEIDTINKKLDELNLSLENLRSQEKLLKTNAEKSQQLRIELETLEKTKAALEERKTEDDILALESAVEEKREALDLAKKADDYLKSMATFETLKAEYDLEKETKLAELASIIKSDEEIEEMKELQTLLESQITDYEILRRNVETLTERKAEARNVISDLFREIKESYELTSKKPKDVISMLDGLLAQNTKDKAALLNKRKTKKRFKCPECSKLLALTVKDEVIRAPAHETVDDLHNFDEKLEEYSKQEAALQGWICRLREESIHLNVEIPELPPNPKQELVTHTRELTKALKNKNDYDNLLEQELPSALTKMMASLETIKESLPDDVHACAATHPELTKKISDLAQTIEKAWKNIKEHAKLDKAINDRKKLLQSSKQPSITEITAKIRSHEENVTKLLTQISEYNKLLQANHGLLERLKVYENWVEEQTSIDALKDELSIYQASLADAVDRLEGAYGLEETCKQAELLAIQKTIDNINEHARTYLDEFFEDPISVRLVSGESKIGVSIEYRDETFTDIDEELSGGERQRCELAFILGINDMVQSKILLLDECLNNVDGEVGADILDLLKTYAVNKPVVVISHDCVEGLFDEVVEL